MHSEICRGVGLSGVNVTAEFFAFANFSAKSKPYAKKLHHVKNGSRWVRIDKTTKVKNLVTLSNSAGPVYRPIWDFFAIFDIQYAALDSIR